MTDVNYDEARIPVYDLPNPLTSAEGNLIQDVEEWKSHQRLRLLDIFENEIYGQAPSLPHTMPYITPLAEAPALDGLAIRKQIEIPLLDGASSPTMMLALYLPIQTAQPVDIFLGLNFNGNHSIEVNDGILISQGWLANNDVSGLSRGSHSSRWSLQRILSRGYGVATIYHADISTDLRDNYENSIFSYFYKEGQTQPEAHEWGAISAWAWGLRRAMRYLRQHETLVNRVMLIGHSRLGKAALWAAAQDEHCSLVISNNSGCMGAALSRRAFGETVELINTNFSRWFCKNFHHYNGKESELPIDQHTLISLIAPRPVYIASAEEDLWADPYGEFLGGYHANPVYQLYGMEGLPVDKQPSVNQPIIGTIGYHIRSGKHDITDYDWQCYLDFADYHLKK